jgi:hypothetical protein
MSEIEEIVVVGKRPGSGRSRDFSGPSDVIITQAEGGGSGPSRVRDTVGAFLAPAAVPQVIEEIIVTAPKPTAPATVPAGPGLMSRLGIAGIVGTVLGLTTKEILDEISEQRLEEAYSELMAPDAFVPADTPVEPMPQPEPIPEIIVTAPRLRTISRYIRLPMPQFFPREFEFDPWVMQPIVPRTMPETRPDVIVAPDFPNPVIPEVAPTLPAVAPTTFPAQVTTPETEIFPNVRPDLAPSTLPQPDVQPLPLPQPQPQPTPDTSPDTSTNPLTGVQPSVGTFAQVGTGLGTSFFPFAVVQPEAQAKAQRCPPCKDKKKREKPRKECWKKMVKEGLYSSWDEEYQWVPIDCITGREI